MFLSNFFYNFFFPNVLYIDLCVIIHNDQISLTLDCFHFLFSTQLRWRFFVWLRKKIRISQSWHLILSSVQNILFFFTFSFPWKRLSDVNMSIAERNWKKKKLWGNPRENHPIQKIQRETKNKKGNEIDFRSKPAFKKYKQIWNLLPRCSVFVFGATLTVWKECLLCRYLCQNWWM